MRMSFLLVSCIIDQKSRNLACIAEPKFRTHAITQTADSMTKQYDMGPEARCNGIE